MANQWDEFKPVEPNTVTVTPPSTDTSVDPWDEFKREIPLPVTVEEAPVIPTAPNGDPYFNPPSWWKPVEQGREAVTRGASHIFGLPVDLLNLGALGLEKGVETVAELFTDGPVDLPDANPIYTGSSQHFLDDARSFGAIDNPFLKPETRTGERFQKAVQGAAEGIPFGPIGMLSGAGGVVAQDVAENDFELGPLGQFLASLGGSLSVGTAANNLTRLGRTVTTGPQGVARDMLDEGVTPRLVGDVTGNPAAQRIQQATSGTLTGGGTVKTAATQTVDDLEAAIERNAARLGNPHTIQETGQVVQSGGLSWVERFKDGMSKRFGVVDQYIQGTDPVALTKTQTALNGIQSSMPDAPNLAKTLLSDYYTKIANSIATDAPNGQLSYQTVKRLRTEIGNKLADPLLIDDVSRAEIKALYAAISDDLTAAASAKGQGAAAAMAEANTFAREGYGTLENVFANIIKKGVKPEQVFDIAMRGSNKGGTTLAALKKELTGEEWGVLSSTVLRRMGLTPASAQGATGEIFSPNTFLTNWNKLAPEAKAQLFDSSRHKDLAQSLDRIARITESMKNTGKLANSSNTAPTAEIIRLLTFGGTGAMHSPTAAGIGVATSLLGPYGAARLMTSPTFTRWLSTPVGKGGLDTKMKSLIGVIAADPAIAEEVKALSATYEAEG